MPIVRRSPADIDQGKLAADIAARSRPGEAEIDRQAAEDGDAWSDEELARAVLVYSPGTVEQVKDLQSRLVQEGIDSGPGFDAAAVFDRLRSRFGRTGD